MLLYKLNLSPTIRVAFPPLKFELKNSTHLISKKIPNGFYKSSKQQKNLANLREFFGDFISLPFDGQAADICGRIRASLARRGTPIGPYDFQIAAIALANNLILVSHNVDEFSRVEGLRIEDWEI